LLAVYLPGRARGLLLLLLMLVGLLLVHMYQGEVRILIALGESGVNPEVGTVTHEFERRCFLTQ